MNKIKISLLLLLGVLMLQVETTSAKENVGQAVRPPGVTQRKKLAGGCAPASQQVDLDINNVRARIMNGGDMWWDLTSSARYEIPKVTEPGIPRKHSLFAGALWIGGFERNNLKEAAMTYRQSGSDFFPGPLDTVTASTDAEECAKWDKIYKISRQQIDNFRKNKIQTAEIANWPAHGDPSKQQARYLAPFVDANNDGIYNPSDGDYPDVKGDQTLWFIYNDKGNIHSETGADAIGLEIQTQAFAFVTNDQISNMTFYYNTITNRSRSRLDSTFFGQWVDADLGFAYDDYVGCDTTLDLGFCYNGDNIDEGVTGYGINPPAVGVDFFEGPVADPNDGIDNNRNGVIDEEGETIGMSKFVYYNNDFSVIGNPNKPEHYYYYLTGRWKDGQCIKYGGDGRKAGPCTNYMFPSDPTSNNPNDWNERIAGNPPGDRRFLQSAGPFSLKPGAKNNVTIGVVWARASSGGPTSGLADLKIASKKAQQLYDNNFVPIIGPPAPDVAIRELDRKIIISLVNINGSLKETESFNKYFPSGSNVPLHYMFEGYQIFQLKNSLITPGELDDPDKAREVIQVDIKNDVTKLVNIEQNDIVGSTSKLMVLGENKGIKHTFEITKDAFATGDDRLVNNRFYYYMVIAYAADTTTGAAEPYLAGKAAVVGDAVQLKAVPHITAPQLGGISLNAEFGTEVELRRIEGMGNSGNSIDMVPGSADELFTAQTEKHVIKHPLYVKGRGPVSIRVYDPVKVANGDFEFAVFDTLVTENFERSVSRPAYTPAANVTLNSGSWRFDNAALLTTAAQRKYGVRAMGMITGGSATMNFDIPSISRVTLAHTTMNRTGSANFEVWFSSDSGKTWAQAGGTLTSGGNLKNDTITVNTSPRMRFEIRKTGGADTLVVDNIAFINANGSVHGVSNGYELSRFSRWTLYNKTTGRSVKADTFVSADYEQLIPEFGFSIQLNQATNPGPGVRNYDPEVNGFLGGEIVYSDPSKPWFTGIPDIDAPNLAPGVPNPINWIRAGKTEASPASINTDDYKEVSGAFIDVREAYERIFGGIIAPAPLVARSVSAQSPGVGQWFSMGPLPRLIPGSDFKLANTTSINLVLTADRSKWTKCLVLEMGEIANANEGGVEKLRIRQKANPFKIVNGLPTYFDTSTTEIGFSWFPGYAVNVETGERLNIMFGEASDLPVDNGADMLWNPTGSTMAFGNYRLGGKHWIYVMNSRGGHPNAGVFGTTTGGVAYDSCRAYHTHLTLRNQPADYFARLGQIMTSAGWISLPSIAGGYNYLHPNEGLIPNKNEMTMKLRVTKPLATFNPTGTVKNFGLPTYSFTTNGLAAVTSQDLGKSALDLIRIVPNPYYAFSQYETGALDNRIRFTNLPAKCRITVYTLNGSIVRRLEKAENIAAGEGHQTYLDWDLKNTANIPIASGVYIVHVDAFELGSKVLKWFGVMRPLDLDTF